MCVVSFLAGAGRQEHVLGSGPGLPGCALPTARSCPLCGARGAQAPASHGVHAPSPAFCLLKAYLLCLAAMHIAADFTPALHAPVCAR